jgi:hypothetical protein
MYLRVRVKLIKTISSTVIKVDIPNGTLNENKALNEVVKDYLDKNVIDYLWYNIDSMPNFSIQKKIVNF